MRSRRTAESATDSRRLAEIICAPEMPPPYLCFPWTGATFGTLKWGCFACITIWTSGKLLLQISFVAMLRRQTFVTCAYGIPFFRPSRSFLVSKASRWRKKGTMYVRLCTCSSCLWSSGGKCLMEREKQSCVAALSIAPEVA